MLGNLAFLRCARLFAEKLAFAGNRLGLQDLVALGTRQKQYSQMKESLSSTKIIFVNLPTHRARVSYLPRLRVSL
jgi:hypothetical protein